MSFIPELKLLIYRSATGRGEAFQPRSACRLPCEETGETASHVLGQIKMQKHIE